MNHEYNYEMLDKSLMQLPRSKRKMTYLHKKVIVNNDRVGIPISKTMASFVVEADGHEHMPFIEQDCRNTVKTMRTLQLCEGDAETIHAYFLHMQQKNQNFFYTMDLGEIGRLKNIF